MRVSQPRPANRPPRRSARSRPLLAAAALALLAAAALAAGCGARAQTVEWISLDFPHGELRLLVRRGGEAQLSYGALPTSRTVARGVFDADALYRTLQPHLREVAPAEARPPAAAYGMVTVALSGGERQHLLYERALAEQLLRTACASSVGAEGAGESVIGGACARLAAP